MNALTLCLHDSMCLRYETEFASPLVLLAVVGVFALERALAGWPVRRRAARCGWGLLLTWSVVFNLFASYKSNADNHQNFAFALLETGRVDEAITQYEKTLEMKPDDEDAHNKLGNALLQKGRVDDAITHFQKALKVDPDIALTHNNLGAALLQKGRVDEAITLFQKAIQLKPDYAEAYANLGNVFLQQGRVDEAITHFQKALEIKPDAALTHNNLGNALLKKGKVDQAITQYQTALQLKPADPGILSNLAWILAAGPQPSLRNGAKAVELARQASLLTGGENPVVLHTLAAAFAEAGRYSEAAETAQHALRLAQAQSNTALAAALESELKLYRAGSSYPSPEQPH
jgi:Flp pilus assembly protein TadD